MKPKFRTGRIVATPAVLDALQPDEINAALAKHLSGDWGEVCTDDWKENDTSLEHGFRLLSAYRTKDGTRFWIITEADRSATTVLLPEDY